MYVHKVDVLFAFLYLKNLMGKMDGYLGTILQEFILNGRHYSPTLHGTKNDVVKV